MFAGPQDPTSPAPAAAWVVDADGPAAVAEHVPTGIAALAADSTNFYVATYARVYGYDRASGNQDGQWTMPPVHAANSSDDNLVAMAAAGGKVFVSVTQSNTVSVYSLDPTTSAAPHLVVRGLGDAIGADGSVYYESDDHHLAVLRPGGAGATGPVLAHTPNGLGGGVQYVDVVAGGAVWVSQPAGQGLDAGFTTYDTTTLGVLGSYSGTVTSSVVDSATGPLVLVPAGNERVVSPGIAADPGLVRPAHRPARRHERCSGGRGGGHAHRPRAGRGRVGHLDRPVRPGAAVIAGLPVNSASRRRRWG